MSEIHLLRFGVAVLRPWPYGPPLRGRAPHHDAETQPLPRAAERDVRTSPASAPVGGLASTLLTDSVL